MATVIYNGVGSGGDLFRGMKFCFLQRVPQRLRWIGIVESNGGEVVKLEKQADVVIADHARKHNPAGSISWRFIEESVKNGQLEDLENHLAGPVTYTAREVGSGGPTRQGRTPFTAEDDRILMDWVVKGERAGISAKGNELYKQLEEKNSRHTFQSWRDRWVKYLQYRPRPTVTSPSAASDGPIAERRAKPAAAALENRKFTSSESEGIRDHAFQPRPIATKRSRPTTEPSAKLVSGNNSTGTEVPTSSPVAPWLARSINGMEFTEEEIQLLVNDYDDIVNIDEDKAIDAWAAWAVANPSHTPQEWRNYFVKQLAPLVEKGRRNETTRNNTPSEPSIFSKNADSQPRATKFDRPVIDTEESQPAPKSSADPALTDEKIFKSDLADLAQELGIEVDFSPLICGRRLPLFRLWQVVKSEEFGGKDEVTGRRLWGQVARKLNFNDFMHGKAAKDLEACYGEILADFEEAREQFHDPTESQERAMIREQLFASTARQLDSVQDETVAGDLADDEEDSDDDLNAPQASPSMKFPTRRSSSGQSHYSSSDAGSYNKRRRVDKGKELEIPSTPEEAINVTQVPRNSLHPSPLKNHDNSYEEHIDGDTFPDHDFAQPEFFALRQGKYNMEPETQDFHFQSQLYNDKDDGEVISRSSEPLPLSPSLKIADARAIKAVTNLDEEPAIRPHTEALGEEDLQAFVDDRIALGYSQDEVIKALEATTMTTGDAGEVMEWLHQGKGIPKNIQGVWTAEDDAALEDEGSSGFERVSAKHGAQRVIQRRTFLDNQREARRLLNESS